LAGPLFTRRDLRHPVEMVSRWLGRPSRRRVKVATSLRFLHEVLGLDRLHYGLWEGEPTTLDGLRAAQDRYSLLMHGWIPSGVRSILDVGCGVGTDAAELTELGYAVEGLSPDPYQQGKFIERTALPFHLARLQDFSPGRTWDLVLMNESAQYVWLDALFPKLRELTPDGWVLLADYFLAADPGGDRVSPHPLERFRALAREHGFEIEREEDVTDRAVPTLELLAEWNRRYVERSSAILSTSLSARHPLLFRLGRRLAGAALSRWYRELADLEPAEFRRTRRYVVMLLRAV